MGNHESQSFPPRDSGQPESSGQPPAASPAHDYFRTLFNAIPSPVVIVDPDVRVQDANLAGLALMGGKEEIFRKRGGEILRCLHASESPAGCGHAPACADCILRNAVRTAAAGGQITRMRARMELRSASGVSEIYLLVTASPFNYEGRALVLLQLEDINELVALKSLLPICAWCGKIRNDDNYWDSVESFFKQQADVDFSHCICPECAEKI